MRDFRRAQRLHFNEYLGGKMIYTAEDLMAVPDFIPKHNDYWGNWVYNEHHFFLYHAITKYEVDIEQVKTTKDMTNWMFQATGKKWANAEDIGQLFCAFYDIFNGLSSTLLHYETFDTPAYLRRRIKDRKNIKQCLS